MNAAWRGFLVALGFLTRLAPARPADQDDLSRAMAWLPAAGLVLGLVALAPFYAGLFHGRPWVQAWLLAVLGLYLTRGLHLDGLCDIFDALGPHLSAERFWVVLKDSRTGAFGVLAGALVVAGQVVLYAELFAALALGVLAWSFVLGRFAALALGRLTRDLARPGLGAAFMAGATPGALGLGLAVTLVSGLVLVPWPSMLAGLVLAGLCLVLFQRLAVRVGGANGDFLGAAVIVCELAACLGRLLAGP
ncbi:MAG: adenosylcobinamide-GDP ribazoletransferase [Desulfovibrionaceae bacterium]|nr:adenosylcobinamide-GDP ribazoletransferase [Desulfovibrionaceae bacterium]